MISSARNHRARVAHASCVLGALASALPCARALAQEPPIPVETPPAVAGAPGAVAPPPAYEPRYHDRASASRMIEAWIQAGAERVDLTPEEANAPPSALRFGAPSATPLAERPAILLVGGFDGVSLSGCEAVLSVVATLMQDRTSLPPGVAFVAVPFGAPEGLDRTASGAALDGASERPLDEDGDRLVDEDGPDDVDGDGRILEMLIEDPAGEWTKSADERFLARARPGDAPRYARMREGRDDDADGRFNEDARGGVVPDVNFPLGWTGAPKTSGDLPLDDARARALADFAARTPLAAVVCFQGNHGALARPGGVSAPAWPADVDAALFERVTALFAQATGRAQARALSLYEARESSRPGAAIDWFYASLGAIACEVAAWGPAVERSPDVPGVGLADANLAAHSAARALARPPASPIDRAWARWLDNTRGGIGFVDWHPVDLGDGRAGLVGGWEPYARLHPPPESLPHALVGLSTFVVRLAESLPRLEIDVAVARRDGEVVALTASLSNRGALATGTELGGVVVRGPRRHAPPHEPQGTIELELVLPEGARLLAGERRVAFERIPGGGRTHEATWVVLAAPGSVFTLRAHAPWTAAAAREVKP